MIETDIDKLFVMNNFDYNKVIDDLFHINLITKTRVDRNKKHITEHYGIEQSFLMYFLAEKFKCENFFEIGTGRGTASYAVSISDRIKTVNTFDIIPFDKKVRTAVNFKPFNGSNKDLYNLIKHESKSKINFQHINNLNNEFIEKNSNKYDLAFIDGNHTNYNIIMKNFQDANTVTNDNGIIVFDDYNNFPVVTKVVNNIIKNHPDHKFMLVKFRGHLFMKNNAEEDSGEVIMFKNPYMFDKLFVK